MQKFQSLYNYILQGRQKLCHTWYIGTLDNNKTKTDNNYHNIYTKHII